MCPSPSVGTLQACLTCAVTCSLFLKGTMARNATCKVVDNQRACCVLKYFGLYVRLYEGVAKDGTQSLGANLGFCTGDAKNGSHSGFLAATSLKDTAHRVQTGWDSRLCQFQLHRFWRGFCTGDQYPGMRLNYLLEFLFPLFSRRRVEWGERGIPDAVELGSGF